MKLIAFIVEHFRSIESAIIRFPESRPVVLFGPNNSGKSNIMRSMELLLGEKWTPTNDFEDSDYFLRDREGYPEIKLSAKFDKTYYDGGWRGTPTDYVIFSSQPEHSSQGEPGFYYDDGNRMYLSKEERNKCQFVLIDANRDMSRQLSYFSKYSMLSRFTKRLHRCLVEAEKENLTKNFENLRKLFESVPQYKQFMDNLQADFSANVDGFEHRLDIDLSAYDPNNYFQGLRISAKDKDGVRSFEEFGTGEQQVLLMAFMSAYARTFTEESFVLGIEEPEAHLHPLAQRWLSKNVRKVCGSGVQVIISTHSPEFLNIEDLEGFVRVYKEANVTKVVQLTKSKFAEKSVTLGANREHATVESILEYYAASTFHDQLTGFFAKTVLLVEGDSEFFAFPQYFEQSGFELAYNGVQVVNCRGKSQLARNFRLFESFGYRVFIVFDADRSRESNDELLGLAEEGEEAEMNLDPSEFTICDGGTVGYFGADFEAYMRENFAGYSGLESEIEGGKPLKAKVISERNAFQPKFVESIAECLGLRRLEPAQ